MSVRRDRDVDGGRPILPHARADGVHAWLQPATDVADEVARESGVREIATEADRSAERGTDGCAGRACEQSDQRARGNP